MATKMHRIRKPEGWLSRGTRVRIVREDWTGKIKGYGMNDQPAPEQFYLIDVGPRDVWARPTEIEVIDR